MSDSKSVFTDIYSNLRWGKDGKGSGRGSEKINARNTSKVVAGIMEDYHLHSLLDAPCGALEWTASFVKDMRGKDPTFTYHGVDVVEHVIEANRNILPEEYCHFTTVDLATEIPPSGYELILCRDALQHLSLHAIAGVMRGFVESGARYLLVTSFKPRFFGLERCNRDIPIGEFFKNDLKSRPFSFREGLIKSYSDHRPTGAATGHRLFLYELNRLARSDAYKLFISEYLEA